MGGYSLVMNGEHYFSYYLAVLSQTNTLSACMTRQARTEAGIDVSDADLLCNPYLIFEQDRRSAKPIAFGTVDRGLFPDEALRQQFPVLEPSLVEDPADPRRVRALVVDLLEKAATLGHTLLPRSWVIRKRTRPFFATTVPIRRKRTRRLRGNFDPVIDRVATRSGEPAYQVERLVECRSIIRREVTRRLKGKQHIANLDWRDLVDKGINEPMPEEEQERELEERARKEKASALEQHFRARLSVLIGPAGTGKTTLLKFLCSLPEVADRGLLLLAPTGKARVRLEEQTGMQGIGQTLAQFLIQYRRFDGETSAYYPNPKAPRCGDYRTVIVDECSMLTEEQLAALIDSLRNVERMVLVGDPRQLPPIGAGRPFVDIVQELEPPNLETLFRDVDRDMRNSLLRVVSKGKAGVTCC